jgi:hypothetical protein
MRQIWKNLNTISTILGNHPKVQSNWEQQGEGVVQINKKILIIEHTYV